MHIKKRTGASQTLPAFSVQEFLLVAVSVCWRRPRTKVCVQTWLSSSPLAQVVSSFPPAAAVKVAVAGTGHQRGEVPTCSSPFPLFPRDVPFQNTPTVNPGSRKIPFSQAGGVPFLPPAFGIFNIGTGSLPALAPCHLYHFLLSKLLYETRGRLFLRPPKALSPRFPFRYQDVQHCDCALRSSHGGRGLRQLVRTRNHKNAWPALGGVDPKWNLATFWWSRAKLPARGWGRFTHSSVIVAALLKQAPPACRSVFSLAILRDAQAPRFRWQPRGSRWILTTERKTKTTLLASLFGSPKLVLCKRAPQTLLGEE